MRTSLTCSHLTRFVPAIALSAGVCLAPGTGHASEAEAAFKARCGECHVARDIRHWGRQHADAAARRAWLDQFLRRHYPPPEAERALIVDYIQSTIAAARAPR